MIMLAQIFKSTWNSNIIYIELKIIFVTTRHMIVKSLIE